MILLQNLLEAPEDKADDYGLDDDTDPSLDNDEDIEKDPDTDANDDTSSEDDNINNEDPPDEEEPNPDEEDPNADDSMDDDLSNDEEPNPDEEDPNADDSMDDDSNNETDNGEMNATDDEKRKIYILSKSYQKLYNMTDAIITNIEKIEFENDYKITAKNYAITQLFKMKDLLYDYITITFKAKTYEQNCIFLEKYKDSLKIIVKTLQKVQESNS